MPGSKFLRKLQIGREGAQSSTDAGTDTAATALLRFEGVWKDDLELVFPMENVGYIGGRDRTYINKYLASMAMEGPATFEQLPYILEASLMAATPTTDSGSGYIYTYNFPTTAQGSISVYTIEGGDDQQEEEASFAYVSDFELSGASGEVWSVSSNWMGRQVTTDSFTASTDVTATEVEEMLFLKTKLYIDADTDSAGTTLKSNTLLGASMSVTSGWIPKFTADGQLYFSFISRTEFEATLEITFEHDGTAVAEKAAWRNETARVIRLICEGSALTSAGAYTYKTMIIDLAGKWETFDVIGDQDGNDIVTGTFRSRYNSNAAMAGRIVIVNEQSALD